MIQIFTIECKYSYLLSDGARIQAHTVTKFVLTKGCSDHDIVYRPANSTLCSTVYFWIYKFDF